MLGQTVTFDGHMLNYLFKVGLVDVSLPQFNHTLVDRSRGAAVRARKVGTSTITVPLVAKLTLSRPARECISTLLSWLDVDGERWLQLSGDDGLKRRVVTTGVTVDDMEWRDLLTVTFEQTDPYLYGSPRTASIPAGSSQTMRFSVGGDAPTRPVITCAQARNASNTGGRWLITSDGGDTMALELPNLSAPSYSSIVIDCGRRTASIDGVATTIEIGGDWMELAPGAHEANVTGWTGAPVDITWTERWHQ